MVVGVILTVLGGLIALGNWTAPFVARRTGRNVSMIPLIGGIFLAVGIYSITKSAWWALLGFLDLGTVGTAFALPWLAHEFWATSRFARVQMFKCNDSGREITIELFRGDRASISVRFDQSIASQHFEDCPVSIGFSAQWPPTEHGFEVFDYADGRRMLLTRQDQAYVVSESSIPDSARSCTLLEGLRLCVAR